MKDCRFNRSSTKTWCVLICPWDWLQRHKLLWPQLTADRLVGLVVKVSALRAEDLEFESLFAPGFLQGWVIPVTSKLALQWLPCQAPGVIGSLLGLVSPVSVFCDWVRWKVWSATSISVWQHVKLSEQIRPWDTFACCWDVKQPANNQLTASRQMEEGIAVPDEGSWTKVEICLHCSVWQAGRQLCRDLVFYKGMSKKLNLQPCLWHDTWSHNMKKARSVTVGISAFQACH